MLLCFLLNVLEIPWGRVMLVFLTTGDMILTESMLFPRFSRDHQYPESCYRCCQPFNYGCLITGGGLAPVSSKRKHVRAAKAEFQSPHGELPGSFDFL